MQILQWLFKVANEQERANTSCCLSKKEATRGHKAEKSNIVLVKHNGVCGRSKSKVCHKNLKIFASLSRKDIAKDCFYSSINLKRLGSINRRQYFSHLMKMKKEDIARGLGVTNNKADSSTAHVGNKVLPISDHTSISNPTNTTADQCSISEKKDGPKGNKTKPVSRMKELLRWAATAKKEKGGKFIGRKVLHLRNRGALKAVPDDDQLSYDSPKISFRWDVESCSTTSSAYSVASSYKSEPTLVSPSPNLISMHESNRPRCRKGNWITTDSECKTLSIFSPRNSLNFICKNSTKLCDLDVHLFV